MNIIKSKRFKKELSIFLKSSPRSLKKTIIDRLDLFSKCKEQNIPLPPDYKDHGLNDNRRFKDCRDAHLKDDIVVIYQEDGDVVKLLRIGNHNNLLENLLKG